MNGFEIFPFVSFLILLILILGRVVFLKRKGVQVSSDSGKKNKPVLLLFSAFLLIILMWLFELIKPVFQISISVLPEWIVNPLIESLLMKIAGIVVTCFALLFMLITLLHFKNSLRFGLNKKNAGELITTGVFAFSRNPFFLSLNMYFLGIALLQPNLFFMGFAILTLVSIHFFILKEEKFIRSVYGEKYLEYLKKVRRYLGKY